MSGPQDVALALTSGSKAVCSPPPAFSKASAMPVIQVESALFSWTKRSQPLMSVLGGETWTQEQALTKELSAVRTAWSCVSTVPVD
jgi:hypothetical protein